MNWNWSPLIWWYLNRFDGITPPAPGRKYRIIETGVRRKIENGEARVTESIN